MMQTSRTIERYQAKEAVFKHRAILMIINRTVDERGVYEAVRYAWKLDPKKAARADVVLAVVRGVIVGVFVADDWLPATTAHFPGTRTDLPGRWGFVGHETPKAEADLYMRRRIPEAMRKPGAANPVRYTF